MELAIDHPKAPRAQPLPLFGIMRDDDKHRPARDPFQQDRLNLPDRYRVKRARGFIEEGQRRV